MTVESRECIPTWVILIKTNNGRNISLLAIIARALPPFVFVSSFERFEAGIRRNSGLNAEKVESFSGPRRIVLYKHIQSLRRCVHYFLSVPNNDSPVLIIILICSRHSISSAASRIRRTLETNSRTNFRAGKHSGIRPNKVQKSILPRVPTDRNWFIPANRRKVHHYRVINFDNNHSKPHFIFLYYYRYK